MNTKTPHGFVPILPQQGEGHGGDDDDDNDDDEESEEEEKGRSDSDDDEDDFGAYAQPRSPPQLPQPDRWGSYQGFGDILILGSIPPYNAFLNTKTCLVCWYPQLHKNNL